MQYHRSEWAETAGIWHDLDGVPWMNERFELTGEYDTQWEKWDDQQRSWVPVHLQTSGQLVVALMHIIDELKDELKDLKQ